MSFRYDYLISLPIMHNRYAGSLAMQVSSVILLSDVGLSTAVFVARIRPAEVTRYVRTPRDVR